MTVFKIGPWQVSSVSGAEPTALLRTKNGKLQQCWVVTTWMTSGPIEKPAARREWREIEAVPDDAPDRED